MIEGGWRIAAGLAAGVLLAAGCFVNSWLDHGGLLGSWLVGGWFGWPAISLLLLCSITWRRVWPVALALSFCWASWVFHYHLQDRLDRQLAGQEFELDGTIEGLPEQRQAYTRFRFSPLPGTDTAALPRTLLTYWYRNPPNLAPGEHWRLRVQLKPPWGRVNFNGTDRERWLYAQGIGGLATVRSGELIAPSPYGVMNLHGVRHAIRNRLDRYLPEPRSRGVLPALAIADRSRLTAPDSEILARTGTAHLLAISGLHVGLAALFGFWLARLVVFCFPLRWWMGQAYPAAILSSVLAAMVYAALAGFGTSTVRALIMLSVGVVSVLLHRSIHPGQAFLLALAAVLMLDPVAVLSAGFWLSFAAVGVLLLLFAPRRHPGQKRFIQLLQAQGGIMLVMLPLTLWWFQSGSLAGLAANLIAIPWVSLVIVPLTLLGMLLMPVSDLLALGVFIVADAAAGLLLHVLGVMADWPLAAVKLLQPPLWSVLLATLGALCLLLPRGLPHRWLGLILMLPLFLPSSPPGESSMQMDVLDVGQGTAVLISTASHLLVYDSGPGNGADFDLADEVIVPAVLQSGHPTPERIVISHGDLDHSGGLNSLRRRFPEARVFASLPVSRPGITPCQQAPQWNWQGVEFRMLHPTPHLPYLGNDSSCVLSVSLNAVDLLLTGDISATIEQRLLHAGLEPHEILLVPHHGSNSSSSTEFLRAMHSDMAIATAGLGNRFGFPRAEVAQRYQAAGVPLWSTDACGALRIKIDASGGIEARSARRERPAPWRWPAGENCP